MESSLESERHIPNWGFAGRRDGKPNASIEVDVGVITARPLRDFQGHIEQFLQASGQFAEFA